MAQKKLYRYLMILVMATFFTFILALNAFAAITGGIGQIEGLEDGVTYKAKPVTINEAGTGYAMGEAITLDKDGNKNLAGLYVVSSDDFATWSDIIYVQGSLEGRQKLGTFTDGATVPDSDRTSMTWEVGVFKGYGTATVKDNGYEFNNLYSLSIPSGTLMEAVNSGDESAIASARAVVKEKLEGYYLSYAYASDEIIPADEVVSLTFANFKYGNSAITVNSGTEAACKPKLEFYVMNEKGKVEVYTWEASKFCDSTLSGWYAPRGVHTIDAQSVLPEDGWVVGFKYYIYGTVNAEHINISGTNDTQWYGDKLRLAGDYYVVSNPKAPAPVGITYDAKTKTVSGLKEGTSYVLAPYTVVGAGEGQTFTAAASTYTLADGLSAGLWGVSVAAGTDYLASKPCIFYVEGLYENRAHLGTETDGVINATRDRNGAEWKLGYYFGANYSTSLDFNNNYGFGSNKAVNYFGAEFTPTSKMLYDAITAETNGDTSYTGYSSQKIKEQVKTILENYFVSYAYTSDEIIPVDELLTVKFARGRHGTSMFYNFKVSPVTGKAIFYVMDNTGKVTPYTWTGTSQAINWDSAYGYDVIEDVQSVLPEEGWVVGIKYYPAGIVDLDSITYASETLDNAYVYEFKVQMGSKYDGYYVISKPKAEAPKVTYSEGTISGLTVGTTYTLAPYTVLGAGEGQTLVATSTTATVELSAGLWGISVSATETNAESNPFVFYVEGSIQGRQKLGTFEDGAVMPNATRDRTSAADVWKLGYYLGVNNTGTDAGITGNTFITDYAFSTAVNNGRDTYGTYTAWPTATDLKTAIDSSDKITADSIRGAVKSILESYSVNYAYTSDEIIPVDELLSMKVARSKRSAYDNFTVTPVTAKLEFYVMDETGKVTPYTWIGESSSMSSYTSALVETTIDVQSVLPESGWVVGFKYFPVGSVSADSVSVLSTGRGTGTEGKRIYDFNIRVGYNANIEAMADYYVIAMPKAETPSGVEYTANTKTLSGLTDGYSYTLAPYTVLGAGEGQTITATGTTAAVELSAGLWGIKVNAGNYNGASDLYVFYVEGDVEARADLGRDSEGTVKATRDMASITENIWKLGEYYGAKYVAGEKESVFNNHYTYNASRVVNVFGAEFAPTPKAFADAIAAEDEATANSIKTQVKTIFENYFISYGYMSDEIIPVDELVTMKFSHRMNGGLKFFAPNATKSKVEFYVMDDAGNVTPYTWTGTSKNFDNVKGAWTTDTVDVQTVLPESGWVVGFKYYPIAEVALADIVSLKDDATDTYVMFQDFQLGSTFDGYYVIKGMNPVKVTGASLLLDGAIGIKLYMDYADNVTAITFANVDEYTKTAPVVEMANGKASAIFYVNPKDAADFTVAGDIVYTVAGEDKTVADAFSLSVPTYVQQLKDKAEAGDTDALAAKPLVEALEAYYTQADIYFNGGESVAVGLTDEELADIAGRANPVRTGNMPAGLVFSSTSLILEDTATIRHYMKIEDYGKEIIAKVNGQVQEEPGWLSTESGVNYIYVDVANIAADDLKTGYEIAITDGDYTCTFTFSVLDYVKLVYNYEDDVNLMNLGRAIYKYAVAADNYINRG